MDRNETIGRIKAALKRRSTIDWSVTAGRGTTWGWITIDAPPSRRTWEHVATGDRNEQGDEIYKEVDTGRPGGHMSPARREELARLLGLDYVHFQGVSIPAGWDYWREYIERAEGLKPSVRGQQYWD